MEPRTAREASSAPARVRIPRGEAQAAWDAEDPDGIEWPSLEEWAAANGVLVGEPSGGFVYFARCGDLVEIGWADDVGDHLDLLRDAYGDVRLVRSFPSTASGLVELHERFAHLRTAGEWFRFTNEIREAVLRMGAGGWS